MAEQKFTLEDIKDFLEKELEYKWTFQLFDRVQGIYRKAKIEDFDRLNTFDFRIKQIKSYEEKNPFYWDLMVTICGDSIFRIIGGSGDYSKKWQKFLDERYNVTNEHTNS